MKDIDKKLYYTLSFTWGLPLTIIGCVVAIILLVTGHKPKRFSWGLYFEMGPGFGNFDLGPIFLCSKDAHENTKAHEFGHSIQNCYYGPLMIFIVALPSVIRYWIRKGKKSRGENLPAYDSAWFEGQATELGKKYMDASNGE